MARVRQALLDALVWPVVAFVWVVEKLEESVD